MLMHRWLPKQWMPDQVRHDGGERGEFSSTRLCLNSADELGSRERVAPNRCFEFLAAGPGR